MDYKIIHHGESTVEISLGKTIDMKINLVVHAFFSFLTENLDNRTNFIVDFYPTYHSIFIDFNILFKSMPASPMNGFPASSSFCPGPSPTIINLLL